MVNNESTRKKSECVICGFKNLALDFKVNSLRYLQCLECKALLLGNPEEEGFYKDLYDYEKPTRWEAKQVNPALEFSRRFYLFRGFRKIYGKLINYRRANSVCVSLKNNQFKNLKLRALFAQSLNKKVLDVGCGPGDFLLEMKNKGWNVYGVEMGKYLKGVAESKLGDDRVFRGDFNRINFSNNKYDAVTFWHVLEHMSDPGAAIKKSASLLKDNGILVIEVPHSQSFNLEIFKKDWTLLLPPQHLHFYSQETFEQLFEDTDLRIQKLEYPTHFPFVFLTSLIKKNHNFIYLWPVIIPISIAITFAATLLRKGDVIRVYAVNGKKRKVRASNVSLRAAKSSFLSKYGNPNLKQIIRLLIYKFTPRPNYDEIIFSPQKGDIAIDCGANPGDITEKLSKKGATVYAFEPNPYAYKLLKNKFKNKPNVVCINKAVWDRNTTSKLYFTKGDTKRQIHLSTSASLVSAKVNIDRRKYVEVKVVDLINFIQKIKGRIKVVKIDVEGAEYEILNKIIKSGIYRKIDYILVETHENRVPGLEEKMNKVRRLIRKLGISNIKLDWD